MKGNIDRGMLTCNRLILPDGFGILPTNLLVNFSTYVEQFAAWHNVPVRGKDKPMPNVTARGITIINDQPMIPEGVKTAESDQRVSREFGEIHLRIGIDSLAELINNGLTVKHLKF